MGSGKEKSQSPGTALATNGTVAGKRSGGAAESTLLCRRFCFWLRMIMDTLWLEEDGVLCVTPEMGYRVAAVAPACNDLQTTRATTVRARFTFVLQGLIINNNNNKTMSN